MTIYDHGTWSRYVPENPPSHIPLNAMFCRNDVSGMDWYDYIQSRNLSDESVKLVCFDVGGNWIVKIATVIGSRLFPQNARLLEIYDGDIDDPTTAYVGKMYDPSTETLVDAPPAKLVASALQIRTALNQLRIRESFEAYVASQGQDVKDIWFCATEFVEDCQFILDAVAALGLTDEQRRYIFELAVTL